MSSHGNAHFAWHSARVLYDFDPQYQRQLPHSGSDGAIVSGPVGAVSEGVAGAAAEGAIALAAIANTSTQKSRGSTALDLFMMITLLSADDTPRPALGQ
jgi:hypothetical protein